MLLAYYKAPFPSYQWDKTNIYVLENKYLLNIILMYKREFEFVMDDLYPTRGTKFVFAAFVATLEKQSSSSGAQ